MSRDPRYQKLLNSRRWRELRAWKLAQTEGYCEICYREGWRGIDALAVDIHHIRPVEEAKTVEGPDGMAARCFDPSNLMALCVKHHIEIHTKAGSHKKENVHANKQRAAERRASILDPNYKQEDEEIRETDSAVSVQGVEETTGDNDRDSRRMDGQDKRVPDPPEPIRLQNPHIGSI